MFGGGLPHFSFSFSFSFSLESKMIEMLEQVPKKKKKARKVDYNVALLVCFVGIVEGL